MTIKHSVANLSNAALAAATGDAFKLYAARSEATDAVGMRALLTGAIYYNLRAIDKDSKKEVDTLLTEALSRAGYTEATISNYRSKIKAAANTKFFSWQVNLDKSVKDNITDIEPFFVAFWSRVNNIKATGPDASKKTRNAVTAPEASSEAAPVPQAETSASAAPVPVISAVEEMIGQFELLSGEDLLQVQKALTTELKRRASADQKQALALVQSQAA